MGIKAWIRRWLLDIGQPGVREVDCVSNSVEADPRMQTRMFVITEALNGSYITFTKRKYNPNGPDDHRHEVYLVQNGESLVDAISTVLVLTEK
jgi:hypothetical protein